MGRSGQNQGHLTRQVTVDFETQLIASATAKAYPILTLSRLSSATRNVLCYVDLSKHLCDHLKKFQHILRSRAYSSYVEELFFHFAHLLFLLVRHLEQPFSRLSFFETGKLGEVNTVQIALNTVTRDRACIIL